ncbi:MAG: DUF2156 domain-containing protein [Firmicutes bacterium]|nr:DUF2156 domain-containing protein [Bacillota bacterium]
MSAIFARSFDDITAAERELMDAFFKGYDYQGCGYTFLNYYAWRGSYNLAWEVIDGYLCALTLMEEEEGTLALMSMPMTKDGSYDIGRLRDCLNECRRRFREAGIAFAITVPAHMMHLLEEAFPGELQAEVSRDYSDYVYLKEKLVDLSGRALHKKKNHLNYFLCTYEYEARPITPAMRDEVLALADEIKRVKELDPEETESIDSEYEAIAETLALLEQEKLYTVAVYVKGKLEAFAIGERLSDNTAVEHFEKANDAYRGLYQLVLREFCERLPEEVLFVNREEDMGLLNLRQAKEALKPDHMMETCYVTFTA